MVELIVAGILELFRITDHTPSNSSHFPIVKRYACPGCNIHAARHDVRHSRGEDCKFPYDDAIAWNCAACKQHKGSTHAGHSFDIGDCQWAEARSRKHVRDRQQGEPRVPQHINKDAAEDEAVPSVPLPVQGIAWIPVTNLEVLTWLDTVRTRDGWHPAKHDVAMVETNQRRLRSCEPRIDGSLFCWRSVFGMMPEHSHQHGSWFQLEDHILWKDAAYDHMQVLQPAVPVCVAVFS